MSLPSQPERTAQPAWAGQQQHQALEMTQPRAHQPMDTQRRQPDAQPESDVELNLRGGEPGRGMCPGRFCFIPCPINCQCFIIPCPC